MPLVPSTLFCVELSAMVVGYGFNRGRGRCYTLWRDFMACAEKHRSYGANVCHAEREDYIECLHHTKLVCLYSHRAAAPVSKMGMAPQLYMAK